MAQLILFLEQMFGFCLLKKIIVDPVFFSDMFIFPLRFYPVFVDVARDFQIDFINI